jgi:translocation and assembly module TamB
VGEQEGFIMVDGRLPPTGTADLRLRAQSVDLRDIQRILPDAPVIEGILTLDAVFEGPVAAPEMRLEGSVTNLVFEDARADLVTLSADYVAQRLEGRALAVVDGIEIASAELSVPMVLSYEDFIPSFELRTTAPLSAAIVADSLPMALLAAAVPALENGTGIFQARVDVGGTLDVPEFQGTADIRNAAVSIVPLGTRYSDIQGRAAFTGSRIDIQTLTARNVGTLSASGFVQFVPRAGPQVNITTSLNRFRLMDDRDVATLTGTGQVTLAGQFPSPVLTGRIVLDESTIRVPEFDEETGLEIADVDFGQIGADTLPAFALAPAFLQQLRIDALEVSLGESVWLVSQDVRVQIAGDLIVYRTARDLRLFGALEAVRGRYALRIGTIVREFDVVSGRVQFFGTGELNPALDIVAAHRVRTATAGAGPQLTVLVNVTGTLAAPRIQLTSDTPTPLPESELLSYLIFGRPNFELGGIGGALAEQLLVQEVLGGILATELERPILEAGLCDYVRVVPGVATFGGLLRADFLTTLGAATIECGRELTDNVFLTVETGIGPLFGDRASLLWGVGLEWQITPEWMWEMSYGPVRRDPLLGVGRGTQTIRYQLSTDIRRRWEYGLPTRRVPIQIPDPGSPPVELNVGPGGSGDAAAAAPPADGTAAAQARRPLPPRPEDDPTESAGSDL